MIAEDRATESVRHERKLASFELAAQTHRIDERARQLAEEYAEESISEHRSKASSSAKENTILHSRLSNSEITVGKLRAELKITKVELGSAQDSLLDQKRESERKYSLACESHDTELALARKRNERCEKELASKTEDLNRKIGCLTTELNKSNNENKVSDKLKLDPLIVNLSDEYFFKFYLFS